MKKNTMAYIYTTKVMQEKCGIFDHSLWVEESRHSQTISDEK